jgi:hypothetical protein
MGFFNRLFSRTPSEEKDARSPASADAAPAKPDPAPATDGQGGGLAQEAKALRAVKAPAQTGTPTPMMVTPKPGTPTPAPAPVVAVVARTAAKTAEKPAEKPADKAAETPALADKTAAGDRAAADRRAAQDKASRHQDLPAPVRNGHSARSVRGRSAASATAPAKATAAATPAASAPAPPPVVAKPPDKPAPPPAAAEAPETPAPDPAAPVALADASVSDLLNSILERVDQIGNDAGDQASNGNGGGNGNGAAAHGTSSDSDLSAVRATFEALAGEHLFQVRGMLAEARIGRATAAWISPAQSEVRSLRRMAAEVEVPGLAQALAEVESALDEARRAGVAMLEGGPNDRLLDAGARLRRVLPAAFATEDDNDRRQAIIVQALLQQSQSVDDWTVERLFAAGLNRLDRLLLGRADEIAAAAGVAPAVAAEIAAGVASYKQQGGGLVAALDRGAELRKLAGIVSELSEVQQAFDRASSGWSEQDRTAKRRLRRRRETVYARVRLALARLGELERLARLEQLPFQRKIEELEPFVAQARLSVPPGAAASA